MNLGTTCIFDHREMCTPHVLYIVHFTSQLTLEEARSKMTKITGVDFSEGAYFSVGLDYIDCTRLYHQIQIGDDNNEEVTKNSKLLLKYRPQIFDNVLEGNPSNRLHICMYDEDLYEYLQQNKFRERMKVAMKEGLEELRSRASNRK